MFRIALGMLILSTGALFADEKSEEAKPVPTEMGGAIMNVPGSWVKQKATRMFRKLQWGIPKAEGDENSTVCYVSELRGGGGGAKANIERWINEYAKRDGEPKQEQFEADGIKISVVEVKGTFKESMGGPFGGGETTLRENYCTLAAWVEIPDSDAVYSIKMVGPKKSVEAQRKATIAMLKGMKKKG